MNCTRIFWSAEDDLFTKASSTTAVNWSGLCFRVSPSAVYWDNMNGMKHFLIWPQITLQLWPSPYWIFESPWCFSINEHLQHFCRFSYQCHQGSDAAPEPSPGTGSPPSSTGVLIYCSSRPFLECSSFGCSGTTHTHTDLFSASVATWSVTEVILEKSSVCPSVKESWCFRYSWSMSAFNSTSEWRLRLSHTCLPTHTQEMPIQLCLVLCVCAETVSRINSLADIRNGGTTLIWNPPNACLGPGKL